MVSNSTTLSLAPQVRGLRLALGVAATAATLAFSAAAPAQDWQPLSIVDVEAFPDDEQPRFQSQSKSIWRGPGGASLIWSRFNPTFDDQPPGVGLGHHADPAVAFLKPAILKVCRK